MKEIKKEEIKLLVKENIIFNSSKGFINKKGNPVGFYRTRNKRYIEDRYVEMAKKLS